MRRVLFVLVGVLVLSAVTFANPLEGNVLGFCPPSEGHKAIAIDGVVAFVDLACVSLVYLGLRG
jgi:hypothetical protein